MSKNLLYKPQNKESTMTKKLNVTFGSDIWQKIENIGTWLQKSPEKVIHLAISVLWHTLEKTRCNSSYRLAIVNIKNPKRNCIVEIIELK